MMPTPTKSKQGKGVSLEDRIKRGLEDYAAELRRQGEWIGFLDRNGKTKPLMDQAVTALKRPLGTGSEREAKWKFKDLCEDEIATWVRRATGLRDHWGPSWDSEDDLQEALIKAIRYYDPARGLWEVYLRKILSRQHTDAYRRRSTVERHQSEIVSHQKRSAPRSPESAAARRETRRLLDQIALQVLSPEQLAYLQAHRAGYSDRKIARIVDKDHKTVHGRLVVVLDVLRQECDRRGLDFEDFQPD